MKRMCLEEIKDAVRSVVEGQDEMTAALALRELAFELDPSEPEWDGEYEEDEADTP